jgi:hypothetical protein
VQRPRREARPAPGGGGDDGGGVDAGPAVRAGEGGVVDRARAGHVLEPAGDDNISDGHTRDVMAAPISVTTITGEGWTSDVLEPAGGGSR